VNAAFIYAVKFTPSGSPVLWLRKAWLRLPPARQLTEDPKLAAIFTAYENAQTEAKRLGGLAVRHPSAVEQSDLFSFADKQQFSPSATTKNILQ